MVAELLSHPALTAPDAELADRPLRRLGYRFAGRGV
jgi:hypothetical protein